MPWLRALSLASVLSVVEVFGPAFAVAGPVDVLLKSGDVAPDGRTLSGFSSPTAASASKVAFLGTTSAIITKSGSTFTVVAKTGDPLPAPLSGTFSAFFDPVINDAGNLAFRASLDSTSAESGLFYCCDAGAIVPISVRGGTSGGAVSVSRPPDIGRQGPIMIALEGNVLPDTGGGTLDSLGTVAARGNRVAFTASVSGGTVSDGLFLWNHGGTTRIVSMNDPAGGGMTFLSLFGGDFFSGTTTPLAVTGSVAFIAPLVGGSASDGLFVARSNGSVVPVVLGGDPTPIGGVISALDLGEPISRVGSSVIFEASLSASSGASLALMRAKP